MDNRAARALLRLPRTQGRRSGAGAILSTRTSACREDCDEGNGDDRGVESGAESGVECWEEKRGFTPWPRQSRQVRKLSSLIRSLPLPPQRRQTAAAANGCAGGSGASRGGPAPWAGSADREDRETWAIRVLAIVFRQCGPFSAP